MVKKELTNLKKLKATKAMIEEARKNEENPRETYNQFYSAAVEREILKVAIFTRKWLRNEVLEPQLTIFISKKERNWLVLEGTQWRTAKIDMLDIDDGKKYTYERGKIWETEKSKEIVNKYLKDEGSVKNCVLRFQYEVRREQLKKRHRSELDEIDAAMEEVPELPKDFEEWALKNALPEYAFYRKKEKAFVTCCQKEVETKNWWAHNREITCPICKKNITAKAYGKQKTILDRERVGIIQKLKDNRGYVGKRITVTRELEKESGWRTKTRWEITELNREIRDNMMLPGKYYRQEEYKNTGVIRWCYPTDRWGYYHEPSGMGNTQMYTRNLKKENIKLKYIDVKEALLGDQGRYVNGFERIRTIMATQEFELLQKLKLKKFCQEILEGKYREERNLALDRRQKGIKVLRIDRQQLERMKKVNGGTLTLLALQLEQPGRRVTDGVLERIEGHHINVYELQTERTGLSITQTLRYIDKQIGALNGFDELKRYYKDYINMAIEMNMDPREPSVRKPKSIVRKHHELVELTNKKRTRETDERINREYQNIEKDYETNKMQFEYEEDGYKIVVPKNPKEIREEGRRMHHCVGTESYISAMNERRSFIVFLRGTDKPDYTIQVKWDGTIMQAYAAYNKKPNWEEVSKWIKSWRSNMKNKMLKTG